jgi:ankyrin repeat protein
MTARKIGSEKTRMWTILKRRTITLPPVSAMLFALSALQAPAHVTHAGWVQGLPERPDQRDPAKQKAYEEQRRRDGDRARSEREAIEEEECKRQFIPNENAPALHLAAAAGSLADVEKLLAAGAYVNATDPENGWTALHYAAYSGSAEVVNCLLAHKASINLGSGKARVTALVIAALRGNNEVLRALIAGGADLNDISWAGTAVQAAAFELNRDGVMLLLVHGAKPGIKTSEGTTAIDFADSGKSKAIQEKHLEHPRSRSRVFGDVAPADYSDLDAPILASYGKIVAGLNAFGASGPKSAGTFELLKQHLIDTYGDKPHGVASTNASENVPVDRTAATRPSQRITTLKPIHFDPPRSTEASPP